VGHYIDILPLMRMLSTSYHSHLNSIEWLTHQLGSVVLEVPILGVVSASAKLAEKSGFDIEDPRLRVTVSFG
jgi:hypothetical protein